MVGDKGSRRLVKFWWVLSATIGAAIGACAASFFGLYDAIWGLIGVGLPIGVAIGIIEWRADSRAIATRKSWPEVKTGHTGPRRAYGHKPTPRRGQLHAISRRKTAEPPSSGAP
jgi:hypothetical protein